MARRPTTFEFRGRHRLQNATLSDDDQSSPLVRNRLLLVPVSSMAMYRAETWESISLHNGRPQAIIFMSDGG